MKNTIEVWSPRWHDRKVLVAKRKVGDWNEIVFTKTPSLTGKYEMSGDKIRSYPLGTNGKIKCYEIPLDDLVDDFGYNESSA